MAGAIGAHLGRLGIEVQGDGGTLFGLAVVVLVTAAIVVVRGRDRLRAAVAAVTGRAAA
jgi:hypothetical protein